MSSRDPEQRVEAAVSQLMDRRLAEQSEGLRGRLKQVRQAAVDVPLAPGAKKGLIHRYRFGMAIAATVLLAVAIQFMPLRLTRTPQLAQSELESELVLAEIDVEFLQDLDFYYWYSEEDDADR